jgi:DNA polymerase-3 subunit epsilon
MAVRVSMPGQPQHARARRGAMQWASALIARPDTLYIDTETTGFGPRAEIVDVAVVDGAGRLLLDSFVRPDGPIPPDATRIHGITDRHVAGAPGWHVVYPLLSHLLTGRTVVVYNAAFDLEMVNQMNRRCGYPPVAGDWQCAMLRYAEFAAEWNAQRHGYRWHKLEVALVALGQRPNPHRAAGDAHGCRLVVEGMAAAAGAQQRPLPLHTLPA